MIQLEPDTVDLGDEDARPDGDAHGTSCRLPKEERLRAQHNAFLRELEAMMRLRSPHTVQVYGAITSCSDR